LKTAYTLGARVIEKHYTLDKTLKGNEYYHSMDPFDIKRIIYEISMLEDILGVGDLVYSDSEKDAQIPPVLYKSIVNKIANTDIAEDTVLQMDMLYEP